MSEADDLADVPSPIDLRRPADAATWAGEVMVKRPWREAFFRKFVAELEPVRLAESTVLELGSGPGFLAERILQALPQVEYTALDFSSAMHRLAKERLGPLAQRVSFVESDFKHGDWHVGLARYHAVVTLQAVHELRHKRHAVPLYRLVRTLLRPGGLFLVCDHLCGEGRMRNAALFMSAAEHEDALREAGFSSVREIHREGSLVLYRAVEMPLKAEQR